MQAAILFTFVATFLSFSLAWVLGSLYLKQKQTRQIRGMLRKAQETPANVRDAVLVSTPGEASIFTGLLTRLHLLPRLELLLEQAGSAWTPAKLAAFCVAGSVIGLLLGTSLRLGINHQLAALLGCAALGLSPILLLLRKRSKALAEFDKQFPDALDFLARSMRAGHAFSVAIEMLSAEAPDPLGRLFRRVSNDLSLGSTLDEAFGRLRNALPSVDLQFFISSVLLQQETGGNLGEILTKLAQIIRERFRLKGQVRAVSAHGRITGLVLLMMPLGAVLFLTFTNPGYLAAMGADPRGKLLLYGAALGQLTGYLVIRKIVDIKV